MARESTLWKWLSKTPYPMLHMTRVENAIDEGTPDLEGCFDGTSFWCELKVADRPARLTTPIRTKSLVKQSQIDWLRDRWEAGGLAWMLVQVGTHYSARRYLLKGPHADQVQLGLTEDAMARLCVLHRMDCGGANAWHVLKRMTWR
jgi:hypothetical protein